MNKADVEETERIAELQVRRYFDGYLNDTFPQQVQAIISAHDRDPAAHDGAAKKVNRALWVMIGFGAAGGTAAGLGLKSLLGVLL